MYDYRENKRKKQPRIIAKQSDLVMDFPDLTFLSGFVTVCTGFRRIPILFFYCTYNSVTFPVLGAARM